MNELALLGHLVFADAFREQASLCRGQWALDEDGVLYFSLGNRRADFYNGIFQTRDLGDPDITISRADSFFSHRADGYTICARLEADDGLVRSALDAELEVTQDYRPLLCCYDRVPDRTAKAIQPRGIEMNRATHNNIADFQQVCSAGFATSSESERAIWTALSDIDYFLLPHLRILTAYRDNVAVATGMLRFSHSAAYISWVSTVPHERRNGIASALTANLTNLAFDAGAQCVFLSPTDEAKSLYRSLGYREVESYIELMRVF